MKELSQGVLAEILSYKDQVLGDIKDRRLLSDGRNEVMNDRNFIAFLDMLNYTGFVEPFDYTAWMHERQEKEDFMEKPGRQIKSADLEEIRKLVTMHIRIERFAEGHLQKLYADGFFEDLFARLDELK